MDLTAMALMGGPVILGWPRRRDVKQSSAGSTFLWLGILQQGRRLFIIVGPLWFAPAGQSFICRKLRYIMAERYNLIVVSFIICHSANSPVHFHLRGYWFTDLY